MTIRRDIRRMAPRDIGVLKKPDFFNAPAESAVGMPPILRENCVFCRFFA